jgi:hypothetical protein
MIDTAFHSEHGKLIRCDIGRRLVERCRYGENEVISEKIRKSIPLEPKKKLTSNWIIMPNHFKISQSNAASCYFSMFRMKSCIY